jgi:predicted dehydrogenase
MTLPTYKVAVLGTGFGQKIHIPGLQAHHRTEVVAVYHRDQAKAEAVAQSHQIPQACSSLAAILSLPGLDGVAIATPPFLHHEMALAALQAGKHVLLEKPTALSVAEAKAIQQAATSQQKAVVMDFEFRFVPAWQYLAEQLAAGYVGQPRLIKVDWLVPGRADPQRPWSWYARADKGGGALGSIGSHTFDYLAWLFGPIKRLSAQLSTAITERPDPETGKLRPVDADDTCTLLLELADGTPVQINLSAVAYNGRGHWLEVYGDQGTLILGSSNLKDYVHGFTLQGAKGNAPLAPMPIPERLAFPKTYADGRLAPFIRVVDHWVSSIDQGRITAPSIADGVYTQQLMAATQQSQAEGRWISV